MCTTTGVYVASSKLRDTLLHTARVLATLAATRTVSETTCAAGITHAIQSNLAPLDLAFVTGSFKAELGML